MKPLSFFRTLLTPVIKRSTIFLSNSPNQPVIPVQQPSVDDLIAWPTYWKEQGQPWRTEPKIDTARQNELSRCCAITPDIEKGIYPFRGMKLSRDDIEWLLSSHEFEREGLDVRGADLSHENLQGLPLTRLRGGLTFMEWSFGTSQERSDAAAQMEQVNFTRAQLDGAIFGGAQLQEADFHETRLAGADFTGAQLQAANFSSAHLWRAMLSMAHLEEAKFDMTTLQEANLKYAKLNGASFIGADLTGADVSEAQLEKANFNSANLERTGLHRSHLGRSDLRNALLKETLLSDAILADKHGIGPRLVDAQWNSVNLAVVNWTQVIKLDDELEALKETLKDKMKAKAIWGEGIRFDIDHSAVRANRQLAVVLQAQGMNEEAAHFAYRAQVLQKRVLLFQMLMPRVKFGRRLQAMWSWLFSWFLFLLAGYGYRPKRSLFWYLAVICGFAAMYSIFGSIPLFPDALVFSLTSFHGRGFFPGLGNETSLHNPLVILAAIEAVIGLFIEISFIATFTQRFFGK